MRRSITALLLGVAALTSTFAIGQQAIAKPSGHQSGRHGDANEYTNEIYVRTGSRASAGTNAPVWLWAQGTRGTIGPVLLPSAGRLLTRRHFDHYQVDSHASLGRISRVCLFRRDGGVNPSWFVDDVKVNGVGSRFANWIPNGRWVCVDH